MSEATPRPWHTACDPDFPADIEDAYGHLIANLHDAWFRRDVAVANAALIVRAVNRDGAVEALLQAAKELDTAIARKWDGETERRRSNALSPRIEDAIVALRAAIAQVEGKS